LCEVTERIIFELDRRQVGWNQLSCLHFFFTTVFWADHVSEERIAMIGRWFRDSSRSLLSIFLFFLILHPFGDARQAAVAQPPKQAPSPTPASSTPPAFKEDLHSLSLAGSNLTAAPPLFGEKDDNPEFTRELLRVQWRPNDPIDLYVMLPKGVKNPPAVLYLYSYPLDSDRFRDDNFCKVVTQNGFAAIGFVAALTGQRYHDRPMSEWFISDLPEALVTSVHDVQMILNYLSSRGDVDMDRIGMFGDGSGGTIAILAAAVDARIKALDLLEPWGDWPDWLAKSTLVPEDERANYIKADFLKQVAPFDPIKWLPQLQSRHVRLQEILNETLTPKIARERIDSAMPSTAKIIRNENSKLLAEEASAGKFFEWLKEQVRSATDKPEVGHGRD
jgi:hypothetical protein